MCSSAFSGRCARGRLVGGSMKTSFYAALFLALFALLSVPHRAIASTLQGWATARQNCLAVAAWASTVDPADWHNNCVLNAPLMRYDISWRTSTNSCVAAAMPNALPCDFSGPLPPVCTPNQVVPVATYRWADGTECDGQGCMLGGFIGGIMNGQDFMTGEFCPYDPTKHPPDEPPPPPPSSTAPPPVPQCNADGSCTICSGDKCATTGGTTDQGPPPASPSSTTDPGNHATDSGTTYNGGGYPSGSTSTGSPGSGSTTGGTGGTGDTGTGTGGYPIPPTSADTKCTTGVCDVGEADGAVGGLYQHSSDTIAGVFGGYMSAMKSAPIIGAAGAFFQVSAGGSCPSWHIPGNQYWGQAGFDFSFFCSSAMLALLQLAGFLVLAAGAFCAFRIALY